MKSALVPSNGTLSQVPLSSIPPYLEASTLVHQKDQPSLVVVSC